MENSCLLKCKIAVYYNRKCYLQHMENSYLLQRQKRYSIYCNLKTKYLLQMKTDIYCKNNL